MTSTPLPATMRVPRFLGEGRIDFIEKPVPEPGHGQLLIRIAGNALCGSERGQFLNGSQVTPGHEAAGTVAAAGPGTRLRPGTPGVIYLMDFCGECRSCRRGFTNQCLHKRGDMGFNRDGGYGAYELVGEHIFHPVNEDIPLSDATLLLDIMGTGGHALKRAQLVRQDIESVLITGAGPMGLGVLAMTKLLLGDEIPVFISDVVTGRLELAERLGGMPIRAMDVSLEQGLRQHGRSEVDVAIDTSGRTEARQACMGVLAKRGVLVCVGHGGGIELSVSQDLIAPERAVLGSEYFQYSEIAANIEHLRRHHTYLRQIITHRYKVDEIQAAFELFFRGATGKVVIEP
ncbi:MAG TPA: alcohol dehydrogenase catalytic domain-containing protein [Herpetosiphonaceae bacterium]|nr:alcohol dehydrogenase catalytic domain-containing protein [Herpetosiphonaceae bacterium]